MKQMSRRFGMSAVPILAVLGLLISLGQSVSAATPEGRDQNVTAMVVTSPTDHVFGSPVGVEQAAGRTSQSSPRISPFEADCPRGPESYDIGPGATGTAVKEVQCLLNWALSDNAYPYIEVDGVYGRVTTEGVKVFQRCANNLGAGLKVDGRVGPKTLPHLRWWGQQGYQYDNRIC